MNKPKLRGMIMTDRIVIGAIAVAIITASTMVAVTTRARAHDWYPQICCSGRDCAPVDEKFISEKADGYHVNLPAGSHPMLKKQGYSAIIPYTSAKDSPDGRPHICLAYEGTSRFCFFMPPRNS